MSVKLDDTVCRVCLSSSGNIVIFDGCGKDDQFRYCTSLEAAIDDGLPSKLCKKCNDHLKVAYDFRFQAIYAEKYFRKTIFLPLLKKETNGESLAISEERNCSDELDENMAEIDMLLAIHTEAAEEAGDDDKDDLNNSGFYDDDDESANEHEREVEIIGMETFEKEQKEQKVKIELASVSLPQVSSTVGNTSYVSSIPLMDSPIESAQLTANNNCIVSNVDISTLQQYTSSGQYTAQPVQDVRMEQHDVDKSLHLEILPEMKNDPSTYEYGANVAVSDTYETFNVPTHLQTAYQQPMSMHLQYEQSAAALPLQEPASSATNYDFTYQPQFPPYSAQATEISPAIKQPTLSQELSNPIDEAVRSEVQPAPNKKTENQERLAVKQKKIKRENHSRRDKIECNICGSTFTHLNSLKTHLLKHSGEKPFKCEFCYKAFARKTVLNIHRRLHTGEKPYKCSLCPSAFVTKEALTRHLQKDHEQEVGANFRKDKVSYICSICNKSRCSKYSLASHMKTHSSDSKARRKVVRRKREKSAGCNITVSSSVSFKYSCKICQKGFSNKWELSTHAESHDINKTFECDVCQRTFEKKFQLLYHLQTHDGGDELVKARVQPSMDKSAPKKTDEAADRSQPPTQRKLKKHLPTRKRRKVKTKILNDSDEADDIQEEDEIDDKNDKDFKLTKKKITRAQRENLKLLRASSKIECHICEAVFTHPTSLKTHMLVHSGERPFKCDHCDKSFARKTVLNIHRRLHTGEKPYKCPLCDSACVTKDALMRHMSKDHDDDREADRIKFTCGICHKAMGTKYSLQAHMKLHEQNSTPQTEVKFSCNTCTELFENKADYSKHMEVHDSHRNFQCDICQATFEKKFKLLFHLQTHKIEDLPCKKCGETFTIRENLIQHIKLQHMDPQNMDFQCPHCNVGQYDTRDLKLHMLNVHDVVMGGLNACDLCSESYSTAAEYYKHMHDKHDTISKTCNECDKYFDSRKAFDKHILTHYM